MGRDKVTEGTPVAKVPSATDWLRMQRARASQADAPAPPTCNNVDAIDSRVERFLQDHGVKYAPKSMIALTYFDEKASLSNQARPVPLIPENVDRYAASLKKGEYLPPVIVYPSGQKVVIVDGNNRHAAHKKAGNQFVPGFVIDENTPSETILLLTVAANNNHGSTPDLTHRLRQAANLVGVGHTSETACEAAGVSKNQLGDYMATKRGDQRASGMKIHGFTDLAATSRAMLGRLPLDSVFYQASRVAIDSAMTSDDVRLFYKEIRLLGSENEQIQYVTKISTERKLEAKAKKATGGGGRLASPYQSLLSSLGKIHAVDAAAVARQILTDIDRAELNRRLDAAGEKLIEIQIAIQNALTEVSA
jgi:hypothetical protein